MCNNQPGVAKLNMDRFTKQYIFALLIIALLALLSEMSLISVIRSQENSAALIDISGRQRMISQRIALLISQLSSKQTIGNSRKTVMQELASTIQLAEQSHKNLIDPGSYLYQDSKLSDTVHDIYFTEPHNLNKLILEYLEAGKRIISAESDAIDKEPGHLNRDVQLVYEYAQGELISEMDFVVKQYETESKNRVAFLEGLAILILLITWCALVVIAFLIFKPMVSAIKLSRAELERDIDERKQVEQHLLHVVEQERARISRELHDSVSQQVTGLSMITKSLSSKFTSSSGPEIESLNYISTNLEVLGDELRLIIHDLAPLETENDSLLEALEKLVESANRQMVTDYVLQYSKPEPARMLNHETRIQLLRIVQEAVHNTKKHARAVQVTIELKHEMDLLFLGISDDGVGFKVDADNWECFGLDIMRYRASVIGANLEIASQVGRGTNVICSLPYKPESSIGLS